MSATNNNVKKKDTRWYTTYILKTLFELPIGLDCASLNGLIVEFSTEENFKLIVSFLKKLSNLKSLILDFAIINDDTVSILSRLPSLKSLFLLCCKMTKYHLSKIFEDCTILEETRLYFKRSEVKSIKLPAQLINFRVFYPNSEVALDLSLCSQLRRL
jgi:Leucine-rich repeat (LRR) protein